MLLLFSDDAAFGNEVARRLREIGFPVVSHDPDFAESVCHELDFSGVILDGRQQAKRFAELSERLLAHDPELPLAFLRDPKDSIFPAATKVIHVKSPETDFRALLDFCQSCMGCEDYSTFTLQHHPEEKQFTYLGYPLTLTDYEYRFLLCLLRNAPTVVRADVLLSEAFSDNRAPQSTLRTLASRINQAAQAVSGLRLVQSVYGKGYRLCDGIMKSLHE
jgi:DNA-binding response OmpR family regulator